METDNKSPAFELAKDEKNHSIPIILTTQPLPLQAGAIKNINWYCFATILDHRAIEKVRGIFFYPGVSLTSSIGGVSLERILQP